MNLQDTKFAIEILRTNGFSSTARQVTNSEFIINEIEREEHVSCAVNRIIFNPSTPENYWAEAKRTFADELKTLRESSGPLESSTFDAIHEYYKRKHRIGELEKVESDWRKQYSTFPNIPACKGE